MKIEAVVDCIRCGRLVNHNVTHDNLSPKTDSRMRVALCISSNEEYLFIAQLDKFTFSFKSEENNFHS